MEQLEKRFYPREELAEIAGLDIHGHNFSAQMKSYLERWGYGYEFVPRKGFLITKIPETAEEKLVELLRRVFHVDTQIDTYAFSCFVFAFSSLTVLNPCLGIRGRGYSTSTLEYTFPKGR